MEKGSSYPPPLPHSNLRATTASAAVQGCLQAHENGHADLEVPEKQLVEFASKGVDLPSYLLGERAALERALRQVVPQRDRVAGIDASLGELRSLVLQDNAWLRNLELAGNGMHSAVVGATERLQALEQRLPAVETELARLQGETGHLGALHAQCSSLAARVAEAEAWQKQSVALVLAREERQQRAWTQLAGQVAAVLLRVVEKVDGLGLAVASRILFADAGGGLRKAQDYERAASGAAAEAASSAPGPPQQDWRRRVLGAGLMVVGVEASFRLQEMLQRRMPATLIRLFQPISFSIRLARLILWASTFMVAAHHVKGIASWAATALMIREYNKKGDDVPQLVGISVEKG